MFRHVLLRPVLLGLTLAVLSLSAYSPAQAQSQTQPNQRPSTAKPPANTPSAPSTTRPSTAKPAPAKPEATAPAAKPAPNPIGQASLLGQYGDWGAYTATPAGRKLCFAIAKPASSSDAPAKRRTADNVVYLFISSRPSEKVKDEVSLLVSGYAFRPNAEASLAVGSTSFPLYTQNDGAWLKNAADEARLVETLRKGSDVVVKGTTSRGTQTTDTWSLKGIVQALDRVAQECR